MTRALVLVVPIAWKPGDVADSAPPVPDAQDALLLRLLGSNLLFWSASPDGVGRSRH